MQNFTSAIPTPIHDFKVKVTDFELLKVFRTSLIPNPMMDLVHVWYDDRYWSKILHSTIPIPIHDLKVKVTDKVLGPHCFQTLWYICFMFDMMIDAGPKFYVV